jgi:hypothetical protein
MRQCTLSSSPESRSFYPTFFADAKGAILVFEYLKAELKRLAR